MALVSRRAAGLDIEVWETRAQSGSALGGYEPSELVQTAVEKKPTSRWITLMYEGWAESKVPECGTFPKGRV